MRMTRLSAAIVVTALAVVALFVEFRDNPALILKAGPSRVETEATPALDGAALGAFRDWRRAPAHFGAFAASDAGEFGYVSDYNDAALAEAAALAYCGAPGCAVIARSLPLAEAQPGVLLVSRPSEEAFNEYLTLRGSKAYAVHGSGAGGSWIGAISFFQARRGAIRECQLRLIEWDNPPTGIVDECRVVHVSRF